MAYNAGLTSNNKKVQLSRRTAVIEDTPLLYSDQVVSFAPSSGNVTTWNTSSLLNFQLNLAPNQCLVKMIPELYNITCTSTNLTYNTAMGNFCTIRVSDQSNNEIMYCSGGSNAIASVAWNQEEKAVEQLVQHSSNLPADWGCVSPINQLPFSSNVDVSATRYAALGPAEIYLPQGGITGALSIDMQGKSNIFQGTGATAAVLSGARLVCWIRNYNQPIPRPRVIFPRLREFNFYSQATTAGSALQFQCPVNSQVVGFFVYANPAGVTYATGLTNLSNRGTGTVEINTSSGQRILSSPLCVLRNESILNEISVYAAEFAPTEEWSGSTAHLTQNWVQTAIVSINPDNTALVGGLYDYTIVFACQEVMEPVSASSYNIAPIKM